VKAPDHNDSQRDDDLWPTMVEFLLAMRNWWVALCAEMDLTAAQGHALRVLDPKRPVPMSALAEALVCDASNVTGIVDKLESRGLIARQGSDLDRRVKQLAVTEKGAQVRDQLIAGAMRAPAAIASLSGDAKAHLAGLLRTLMAEGLGH
jgi:MarR family transcriptional regulator, organic hydroperoxide resistance regulator